MSIHQKCIDLKCDNKAIAVSRCKHHYYLYRRSDYFEYTIKRNGLTNHPLSKTYYGMHERCYNTNSTSYHYYGGRGIKVCTRWRGVGGLRNFITDMGEKPKNTTLDRIDTNGNYEPENCKWSTKIEQSINRNIPKNNSSGHKGVCKYKGKWHAYISVNKKQIKLGSSLSKIAAIELRKNAENRYYSRKT